MFLRKFLNKKNLVNIFKKFINYEIYGLAKYPESKQLGSISDYLDKIPHQVRYDGGEKCGIDGVVWVV